MRVLLSLEFTHVHGALDGRWQVAVVEAESVQAAVDNQLADGYVVLKAEELPEEDR